MRKSLERLNRGYEIDQINIVFDFLGCYGKELESQIKRLCEGEKEAILVIEQCQKWVLSQNCEIVKNFMQETELIEGKKTTFYSRKIDKNKNSKCNNICIDKPA